MKIISVQEAAALVKDNCTLATAGFVGVAVPEYLLKEVAKRFAETGAPKDITFVWNNAMNAGTPGRGVDCMGIEGLLKRTITSHYNLVPNIQKLVDNNKIEAYTYPMGQLGQSMREYAINHPGLVTKVGIGTFIDPRQGGGKTNSITKEDLVSLINIDGEEYLKYKNVPLDVCFLRATRADKHGNLSWEHEASLQEQKIFAMATKHNGGVVVAQVESICEVGEISARNVHVPGVMVDYVVVSPPEEHTMLLTVPEMDDGILSHKRIDLGGRLKPLPLDERKIMARRVAFELHKNNAVNLGLGVPESVANIASEEGFVNDLILAVEVGILGGAPCGGQYFGCSYNAEYITDTVSQVDWYESGGLDMAVLGAAEVDKAGNVNVSRFGKTIGPGGFVNISSTTKKVVFCGSMTAGGLEEKVVDGKLVIVKEGKIKKYVNNVEEITFSGPFALKEGQDILYVTDRAVFKLYDKGIELIEIAPGIDLQTQVLDLIDFPVKVSKDLKLMDARIFEDKPMGLILED